MRIRTALVLFCLFAGPVLAQSGLRVPLMGEPGLDPTLARGWLGPELDRFGYSQSQRLQWSYSLSDRYSLGMGMQNAPYVDDSRQLSLYGRYSLTPDWALSAETMSRDPTGLFTLREFRIGVQRRF